MQVEEEVEVLLQVVVVRGTEPYNTEGNKLEVSCGPGLELSSGRTKLRCRKGEWRPGSPLCRPRPAPCTLPRVQHGVYAPPHQVGWKERTSTRIYIFPRK